MIFRATFADQSQIRLEAADVDAARRRAEALYGSQAVAPGFHLEPEDPADPLTREAEDLLAEGRPHPHHDAGEALDRS